MKIAWFCIPAYGHTNPTLAVVRELTSAGHEVFYFSFEQFREKLEAAGAHFIPCDGCDPKMESEDTADRIGKDVAFATELLVNSTLALDEMIAEKMNEIKPDLIVTDSVAFWGKLTAKKYGLPFVSSTTTFAFNDRSSRYMKHGLGETLRMLMKMPQINRQLDRLRAKGYPVNSIMDIVKNDNDTNTIVYTSKYFQPCAESFSDRYRFIGASMRPIETPMEKTRSNTIYVSLGTVVNNETIYRNCITALGGKDCRVIVSRGTCTADFGKLPANIEVYDFVDQMAVLDIADVFITHCGMNSVSESLYNKVPLVMFPQTPEQGAVAKRTAELGAGVIPKNCSPKEIFYSVKKLLSEPSYKQNAAKISESFKACGGAREAREFIESLV